MKQALTRRNFLKTAGAAFAAAALPGCLSDSQRAGTGTNITKPNIVVILADDLGYGDVGCYGSEIPTPYLDALARKGMLFRDFHSNGPVCTPTRAALLTGKYQQRVGMHNPETPERYTQYKTMPLEEVTFAEILKSAGYTTGIFGKWHLGDHQPYYPVTQGFDEYFGLPVSNDMGYKWSKNTFRPPLSMIEQDKIVELEPDQDYLTRRYTEHAVDFIRRHKNEPFLVYLPHNMPHKPVHASPEFTKEFTEEQVAAIVEGDKSSRDFLYPAAVREIDWGLGQIMKALRECGIERNTLVIFTSDNGPASAGSAGPLRGGKGSLYEGGHRVPGIFCWPAAIPAGSVTDETALTMDLLPTFAQMAGAGIPNRDDIDGISLLGLIKQQEQLPERILFFRVQNRKAVRKGPWKLHVTDRENGQAKIELYHLDDDLAEEHNIADQHAELVADLTSLLRAWETKVDAENKLTAEW